MNDTPIETRKEPLDANILKRTQKKSDTRSIILIIAVILLWVGLILAGYWFANRLNEKNLAYIDLKIENEINELQPKIDEMYEKVVILSEELKSINNQMALTNDLLYGTDTNKLLLQQRIDELNLQLNELQATIERLRDATSN